MGTMAQTGGYDLTTTWVGGVVPPIDDPITVPSTMTLTVPDGRQCGDLTLNGSIIATGVLSVNGNVIWNPTAAGDGLINIYNGGAFQPIGLARTITFTGDATLQPELRFTNSTINDKARFGNSTTGNTWHFVGGQASAWQDVIKFNCKNGVVYRTHNTVDGYAINAGQNGSSAGWEFDNTLLMYCGNFRYGAGANPNGAEIFSFKNSDFRFPMEQDIITYACNTAFTAYRGWGGATVWGNGTVTHRMYITGESSNGQGINTDNIKFIDCGVNNPTTAKLIGDDAFLIEVRDNGSNVLVLGSSTEGVGGSTFNRPLLMTDSTNAHSISFTGTSTNQNQVEDGFLQTSHNGSNALLYDDLLSAKRNTAIGGTGPWTTGGSAAVDLDRNSCINPDSNTIACIGFESSNYGFAPDAKNSIIYKKTGTAGYLAAGYSPVLNQPMGVVGNNGIYGATSAYDNIAPTTDNSANDVYADPLFINPDATFLTWDAANGGLGTTQSLAEEVVKANGHDKDGNVVAFNSNYSHANGLAYLQNAFTPTNPAYQGTALDGGDIGPLPVVTTKTLTGLLQADAANISSTLTVVVPTVSLAGALQSDDAQVSGTTVNDPVSAIVFSTITTAGSISGSVQADPANINGSLNVQAAVLFNISGDLQADAAAIGAGLNSVAVDKNLFRIHSTVKLKYPLSL